MTDLHAARHIFALSKTLIVATAGDLRGPRLTVAQAAEVAGTTERAIRNRINRGSLEAEYGPGRTTWVRTGELARSAAERPFGGA